MFLGRKRRIIVSAGRVTDKEVRHAHRLCWFWHDVEARHPWAIEGASDEDLVKMREEAKRGGEHYGYCEGVKAIVAMTRWRLTGRTKA